MPAIKELGYYSGVVKSMEFDEVYGSVKFCVETQADQKGNDGTNVPALSHAYPKVYLANKAGSRNEKSFETLGKIFGWKSEDIMDLERSAIGKSIRVAVKPGADAGKVVYYLTEPRAMAEKRIDGDKAASANAFLKKLNGGGVAPSPEKAEVKTEDLSANGIEIPEEQIPF